MKNHTAVQIFGAFGRIAIFILILAASGTRGLWAQVIINSNDGTTSGGTGITNLYSAIENINAIPGGSVTLDISGSNSVALSEALPGAQSITFLGSPLGIDEAISIIASNEAEGAVTFLHNLTLSSGVTFGLGNDAAGGLGQLDASVTAGNLSMGTRTDLAVTGGSTGNYAVAGNASVTTGALNLSGTAGTLSVTGGMLDFNNGSISFANGGNASVAPGTLTLSGAGDSLSVAGGEIVNNNNVLINNNANGGNAALTVTSLTMGAGTTVAVAAGALNNGASCAIGGAAAGGNATLNAGTLALAGTGGTLNVIGGESVNGGFGTLAQNGGYGTFNSSGTGGTAALSAASLTMGAGTTVTVTAGALANGGASTIVGTAAGGNATMSVTALAMGAGSALAVTGGTVTNNGGIIVNGSLGGSAGMTMGTLNLSGTGGTLSVAGGGADNINGGSTKGDLYGGTASVSITSLTLSGNGDELAVAGGESNNTSGTLNGVADAGSALLSAGTVTISGTGDSLAVTGGLMDNTGGDINVVAVVVNTTSVNVGSLVLSGAGDSLSVAGSGINNTGGNINDPFNAAGNATLTAGSLTMGAGTTVSVTGGVVVGPGTQDGNAVVTIGTLLGSGTVALGGATSSLQVNSGNFAGIIEGNESLIQMGAGALTLTGANSYSGGTSISGGILHIQNDGNLGASGTTLTLDGGTLQTGGTVVSSRHVVITSTNGTLDLDGNNATLSGNISGTGGLIVASSGGSGILSLTGVNSYQGGTSVSGVTLNIQNDGNLGLSGTTLTLNGGSLQTGGSLVSNRNIGITSNGGVIDMDGSHDSLSGIVGGPGSLIVTSSTGAGALTLTGANNFSGGMEILSGTVAFGNVRALGTGFVVNNGVLTSAGTPINLQVGGNYSQTPNGQLQLGLGGLNGISSDHLTVAGTAALSGTLQLVSYGNLNLLTGTLIPVLTASQVVGRFTSVDESLNGMRLLALYLPDEVELETVVPSFGSIGSTGNQKIIGADLDGLFNNQNENNLMVSLAGLSTAQLKTALGQMSPEGLTGLYQSGFTQSVLEGAQITQRLAQLRQDGWTDAGTAQAFSTGGAPMFASTLPAQDEAAMISPRTEDGWSGFAGASGGSFNVSGGAGYQTSSESMVTAGMDRVISKNVKAGLMISYGQVQMGLNGGGTMGFQGGQLGLYGAWDEAPFYINSAVFGGPENISSQRDGYGGTAAGNTNGETYGGLVGLGYDLKTDKIVWGPALSLQYTNVSINGYNEQGSSAALVVPSQAADSLLSQLGAQAQGKWTLGGIVLKPGLNLAWEHEFDYQGGDVQAGFGQGDSFTVSGAAVGQDGLLVSAQCGAAFTKDFSLNLNYQSEIGRTNLTSNQYGGEIGLAF